MRNPTNRSETKPHQPCLFRDAYQMTRLAGELLREVRTLCQPVPSPAHNAGERSLLRSSRICSNRSQVPGLSGERREGFGLGLAICAELARAHVGKLEVQSDARDPILLRHIKTNKLPSPHVTKSDRAARQKRRQINAQCSKSKTNPSFGWTW